jgi:diadenosine tetraphosphate (Ap4A) HIT family hydrolase
MAKRFVNTQSAKGRGGYEKVLSKIKKEGVCPFCEDYFLKYHTRPILRRSRHWFVTENFNPYEGTKRHVLFVHRKHIENPESMSAKAWSELLGHIAWVREKFRLPGGALFMRFGDFHYTGASVAHLHANVLCGEKSDGGKEPIAVTLGFKKKRNPRA